MRTTIPKQTNHKPASQKSNKSLKLPAFFPDATYAAIHSVPFDYVTSELDGVVVTTLHMHLLGLEKELQNFGGFRAFAKLPEDMIILSDSGGFQVLSLISKAKLGKITEEGAIFSTPDDPGRKIKLTPELSQDIQHTIDSDIRIVLDSSLVGDEDTAELTKQLELTTRWAKRSKDQFLKNTGISESEFNSTAPVYKDNTLTFSRPLLGAVVQGGKNIELRKRSAQELAEIGFDLYGFGGWPVDSEGNLLTDILQTFVDSLPKEALKYGMGIGTPDNIKDCYDMGIDLFDCVIPTRNARHGMLFVSRSNGEPEGKTYDVVRIKSSKYQYDNSPIDPECSCPVCRNYNRAYVRFLLRKKNPVGFTLVSVHNIWWYQNFVQQLRIKVQMC
jgi:queuine tRNA-ribosyltransferase